jgi:hypothetical protein
LRLVPLFVVAASIMAAFTAAAVGQTRAPMSEIERTAELPRIHETTLLTQLRHWPADQRKLTPAPSSVLDLGWDDALS